MSFILLFYFHDCCITVTGCSIFFIYLLLGTWFIRAHWKRYILAWKLATIFKENKSNCCLIKSQKVDRCRFQSGWFWIKIVSPNPMYTNTSYRAIHGAADKMEKLCTEISYSASPEQRSEGRAQLARLHLNPLARGDFWGETVERWPWLSAIIVFLCEIATSMRAGRLWVEACKMYSSRHPGSLVVCFHMTWCATG